MPAAAGHVGCLTLAAANQSSVIYANTAVRVLHYQNANMHIRIYHKSNPPTLIDHHSLAPVLTYTKSCCVVGFMAKT